MHIKPNQGDAQPTPGLRWWQTPGALDFFWTVALAAIVFLLLHDSLLGGKGLVPAEGVLRFPPWNDSAHRGNYLLSDQYDVLVPQRIFVYERLREGEFPLWNPQLDCGVPNVASMQGSLLFPIQLLFSWMDPFYASGLVAFLKLFLAGWFTMLYLRLLGASRPAAFLSGSVFSLCGFMVVWLGHPQVNCAMWLPLLLYFVEKSFRGRARTVFCAPVLRSWIGFAAAYGFMLLGGHPSTAVHLTIAVGIYFLFRLVNVLEQWKQQIGLMALALLAGALLAAPQILPFLEYFRQSPSDIASASLQRWATHLTPNTLIHFFIPQICGNPVIGFEDLGAIFGFRNTDNFNETTMYVGILPLFLSICALICRRCKFTWFFLTMGIGAGLIIFGIPPFPYILRGLPVLHDINHVRLLLLVAFSLSVLAGLGWDTISRMELGRKARLAAVSFAGIGICALAWVWFETQPQFQNLDEEHRSFLLRHILLFSGQLIAVVILGATWKRWNPRILQVICLGWIVLDLLSFGYGYNPAIPRAIYYPRTAAIEWLQQDPSIFRILGFGSVLTPNTANVFNLNDARGCDFINVRRYEELITGHAGDFYFYDAAATFPLPFNLLNVKYILANRNRPLNSEDFDLVYTNEILIYRYKICSPRALAVFNYQVEPNPLSILTRVRSLSFDPAKTLLLESNPEVAATNQESASVEGTNTSVQITSYRADEVNLAASLPRPGFLLLLDTYFPGWKATVNGLATPIYRADYNFRAIALPAGPSTIRFVYQPKSFRVGMALAGATLLILVAIWVWTAKRSANAKETNRQSARLAAIF
jgi:hypothetical protein